MFRGDQNQPVPITTSQRCALSDASSLGNDRDVPSDDREIKAALAERRQDELKRIADQPINAEKEDRGHKGQNKHHRRGRQHFATAGPDNLRHFRAGLLQKLEWIGHGVVTSFGSLGIYARAGAHARRLSRVTAIVILGAAVWANGPSPTLRRRTLHGAALFHEGRGDVVIVCGGLGRFAPTEAEVMADVLRAAGVPSEAIRLEDTSTNTVENIRNAMPILDALRKRDVLVVSDAYHLPRARLIARRQGLHVAVSAPRGGRLWPQVKGWLREIPGVIAVLLRIR